MKLRFKLRLAIITTVLLVLWIFRFEMILQFQLQTLRNMGCDKEKRLSINSVKSSRESICSKLWVHRVNSLPRYERLENYFAGFELDVVFVPDSGSFFVRHPPDEVNNLELESYIKEVTSPGKFFWVDIKDLQAEQHIQALQNLIQIKALLFFPSQIIVESSNADFVNLLARNGFTCSYLWLENRVSSGIEKEAATPTLDSAVKYVSGQASNLKDLKLNYPGKKYLIWSLAAKNFYDTKNLENLISDPKVDVVLVNIKSRNYR